MADLHASHPVVFPIVANRPWRKKSESDKTLGGKNDPMKFPSREKDRNHAPSEDLPLKFDPRGGAVGHSIRTLCGTAYNYVITYRLVLWVIVALKRWESHNSAFATSFFFFRGHSRAVYP